MKKETTILLLLAAVNFTQILDFMIMMPLGDNLMAFFQTDSQGFSSIVSSYSLSAGIVGILVASLINNYNRKHVLLLSYAGFTIGTFLCGTADILQEIIIYRVITGAFGVVSAGIIFAIVGDLVSFENRGKAMGIVSMGFALAAAIGVPLGLFLGNVYSWRFPFFMIVAISTIVLIALMKVLPSMTDHITRKQKILNAQVGVVKNSNQLIALSFMMLLLFSQFIIIPYIATFMEYNVGFSKKHLLLLYLIGGIGSVVTGPVFGKIGDKIGKKKMYIILLILSLPPILMITFLGKGEIILALIMTTLFFILSGGRVILATTIVLSTATASERAGFMSIRASLQHFGAGIAATIGGMIVSQNMSTKEYINYSTTGYISIIGGILTLLFLKKITMLKND